MHNMIMCEVTFILKETVFMVCSVKICHIPKTGNVWRRTYKRRSISWL